MRKVLAVMFLCIIVLTHGVTLAGNIDPLDDDEKPPTIINDPWEPFNRKIFAFNDHLYEYLFFPVADGYAYVVPKPIRTGIGNLFHNLSLPVRITGNLMQGKFKWAFVETGKTAINLVFGLGVVDVTAKTKITDNEDVSQGLASWGLPAGPYIVWPIIGPSNLRNTAGLIGDSFLKPQSYLGLPDSAIAAAGEKENDLSLENKYRSIKKGAVDPYNAIRNAYFDNFQEKINK